jgi:hypothetical protein
MNVVLTAPRPTSRTPSLLASKPGLTGRACAVDESAEHTAKAAATAQAEGALLEVETAPVTSLPFETATFDVVVINHLLVRLAEDRRAACLDRGGTGAAERRTLCRDPGKGVRLVSVHCSGGP